MTSPPVNVTEPLVLLRYLRDLAEELTKLQARIDELESDKE